jgi:signal transduction histidine kinase
MEISAVHQHYWQRSRKVVLSLGLFIFLVVSAQADSPVKSLIALIWFRGGHEIMFHYAKTYARWRESLFYLRVLHIIKCLGFLIYFGGPQAPAWLYTILAVTTFTVLFPLVAPDYMQDVIGDDVHQLTVNWYALSICLLFSTYSALCCYFMHSNLQTVSVCFVTCVIMSLFVNVGCSLIRDLRHMGQVVILNKELEKEKQVAEEESEQKSVFIAKVSHELRTPLHAVICCCDFISDTELNPEQREFVKIISKSSNLLLSLINNILDLSKSEAGKMTMFTVSRVQGLHGILKENLEPTPTSLASSHKVPPILCTICLHIDSPSPVPPYSLVVLSSNCTNC